MLHLSLIAANDLKKHFNEKGVGNQSVNIMDGHQARSIDFIGPAA
jgi:hypothetical protein